MKTMAITDEYMVKGYYRHYDGMSLLKQDVYKRQFSNMASASGSNFTRASILFFFLWYFSQRLPLSLIHIYPMQQVNRVT